MNILELKKICAQEVLNNGYDWLETPNKLRTQINRNHASDLPQSTDESIRLISLWVQEHCTAESGWQSQIRNSWSKHDDESANINRNNGIREKDDVYNFCQAAKIALIDFPEQQRVRAEREEIARQEADDLAAEVERQQQLPKLQSGQSIKVVIQEITNTRHVADYNYDYEIITFRGQDGRLYKVSNTKNQDIEVGKEIIGKVKSVVEDVRTGLRVTVIWKFTVQDSKPTRRWFGEGILAHNVLYHGTSVQAANKILEENTLRVGKIYQGSTEPAICFTRSYSFLKDRIKNFPIIFIVNQDKLENNYSINPITDFKNFSNPKGARFNNGVNGQPSKAEEVVYKDITNFNKYLIGLVVADRLYEQGLSELGDKLKIYRQSEFSPAILGEQFIEVEAFDSLDEALSEREKVQMYIDGTRGMNFKACSEDKLLRYAALARRLGSERVANEFMNELNRRHPERQEVATQTPNEIHNNRQAKFGI